MNLPPDREARDSAWDAFERLDHLTRPDDVGAKRDRYKDLPFIRLDHDAQSVFNEWREDLEHKLINEPMPDAIKSHISKYRGLVPALALDHLCAEKPPETIPEASLRRAIRFCKYLESHARRAYASSTEAETTAAKAILAKIRSGDLQDGFTAREVHRPKWSGLSDREAIGAALDLLCDFDWLAVKDRKSSGKKGPANGQFRVNPACRQ